MNSTSNLTVGIKDIRLDKQLTERDQTTRFPILTNNSFVRSMKNYIKPIVLMVAIGSLVSFLDFYFHPLQLISKTFISINKTSIELFIVLLIYIVLCGIAYAFRRTKDVKVLVAQHDQVEHELHVFYRGLEERMEKKNSDLSGMNELLLQKVEENRKSSTALKKSEQLYRELFDKAVQGIFQSSQDGKLLAANPAFLKLLGYSSLIEFEGINLRSLYLNPDERELFTTMMDEKGYCHIELQLKRKDEKIITVVEHSRAILNDDGTVLMYEGLLEDITIRKALEEQLRHYMDALKVSGETLTKMNIEKSKMMFVLSHDLRSPFSGILGFCEILLDEQDELKPHERREFITYIKESSEQLVKLVNELLDWSRIESGSATLTMVQIDLHDLVKKSIRSNAALARQHGISLVSTIPQGMLVRGDETKLLQVINNLVSNSLKFTTEGGEIIFEPGINSSREYSIMVRDTGIGIPEKDLAKVLNPGEKYSQTGVRGEKGTGFGLALCNEIMKKHGGLMNIESKINKGTVVYLNLPVSQKQSSSGKSVLVVDNEKGVRVLHTRYLKKILPTVNVLEASDGNEALQMAVDHQPSLIISDYAMPHMDGLQLLQALKIDMRTKQIPVVMITGHGTNGIIELLHNAGAAEVFLKPLNTKKFDESMGKWMEVYPNA